MPKNKRVDKTKVYLAGAFKRTSPSKGSLVLKNLNLIKKRTLDYGSGIGFDSNYYGWDKYDPYYHDVLLQGKYNTIVCTNVISAVSTKIRQEIIENIQDLLEIDGICYLIVPRNLPKNGKFSGYHRRPQSYVILNLNTIYTDSVLEIYELKKNSTYKDKTKVPGE